MGRKIPSGIAVVDVPPEVPPRLEAPLAKHVLGLDHRIERLCAEVATLRATIERFERGTNEQVNMLLDLFGRLARIKEGGGP
jgi:hypothetical protein